MNPPDAESRRSIVSSAVLVAAVPGLAYGFAFIFEAGYLHQFGLPSWIIRLDISKVFVAVAGLLFVGWLLYWLVLAVPIRFLAVGRWLSALFLPGLLSWFTYAGVRFALRHHGLGSWVWPLVGFACVLGTFYAFVIEPIRALPTEPSWTQRLRIGQRKDAIASPDTILDASLKSLAKQGYDVRWLFFGGLGILLLAQITYWAGEREAATQEKYLVAMDDTSLVALRSYSDHLLVAVLDSTRHRFRSEYFFTPIATEKPTHWRLIKLGRIRAPEIAGEVRCAADAPTQPCP